VKRWLVTAGVLVAGVAVVALVVVASGIVPAKASSGHWAVTNAALHFAMKRSVATHAPSELPPLDDPALVARGAGHYHTGCLPCHGSPERALFPRVALGMTPPPPYLPPRVKEWSPEELFFIVKHGVKFTGMPAWPSLKRDDEVHAMVAFLLELPGLDAEGYRTLAHGEVADEAAAAAPLQPWGAEPARRALVVSCARCHGEDGRGRGLGAFPSLAGQHRDYLLRALRAYADGKRHSGIMQPVAAGLTPEQMGFLADHYAALPPGPMPGPTAATDPGAIARGEQLAHRGDPVRGVPSCVECHGPTGPHRNPAYPHLAGQYAGYLELQLRLFNEDRRGGSEYSHIMRHVASRLSPEQMRDVAQYYGSLPASQPAGAH
jgi:cytochrome c553